MSSPEQKPAVGSWAKWFPRSVVRFWYRVRRWRHPDDDDFRRAFINNDQRNKAEKFCSNYIRTAKYSILTFIPLSLCDQLLRIANFYFLVVAILSLIDSITPYTSSGKWGTLEALIFVIFVSMVRDGIEDYYRYKSDKYFNYSRTEVLRPHGFESVFWTDVRVGDICRVNSGEFFPADLVMLASSAPCGTAYIETANLDGETNLKLKTALKLPVPCGTVDELLHLSGEVHYDFPNDRLYSFDGSVLVANTTIPVGIHNLLLRGALLRNTDWVHGFVVYTGTDTKLVRNSHDKQQKSSRVEQRMSRMLIGILALLMILCGVCVYLSIDAEAELLGGTWYLLLDVDYSWNTIQRFCTFLILLSGFIPISLYVTIEIVRGLQCMFINSDVEMYDPESDTPSSSRSSVLTQDLGQVAYLFSDKTGTLTRNVMEFMSCSIAGAVYGVVDLEDSGGGGLPARDDDSAGAVALVPTLAPGDSGAGSGIDAALPAAGRGSRRLKRPVQEPSAPLLASDSLAERAATVDIEAPAPPPAHAVPAVSTAAAPKPFRDARLAAALREPGMHGDAAREFLTLLAVCHTVVPERVEGKIMYQAASPDEDALVKAARDCGYVFVDRTSDTVSIEVDGRLERFDLLAVLEFNSTRKRMSVVVRAPDGQIKLYCKGADTVIFERLEHDAPYVETTEAHLEAFASQGLRTLCLAWRTISEDDYKQWQLVHHEASVALVDRDSKVDAAAELIERDLKLLGATAIEDRLQDGVADTLTSLHKAGIKVWVLTGDRQETSVNIGFSCGLLDPSMRLFIISEQSQEAFESALSTAEKEMASEASGEGRRMALIIDGHTLAMALDKKHKTQFMAACRMCFSVICCRVAPLQKAQVVNMVKEAEDVTTLAIGDGANDVGMIRAAHIGVGVSGKEGRQAVLASDFAIPQFRFLKRLLLVHGRWNYQRVARCILYSVYKNVVFSMIIFWYLLSDAFSGSTQIESTLLAIYNLCFTALPIIALAVLDRDTSDKLVLANPHLYTPGIKSSEFNIGSMAAYFAYGIVHSVAVYFVPMVIAESGMKNGWEWGMYAQGLAVYTALVLTTTAKVCLMVKSWIWITHFAVIFSVLFYYLFIWAYSIPLLIDWAPDIFGVPETCFAAVAFWLASLVTPLIAVIPDVTIQMVQLIFFPSETDVLLERALLDQRAQKVKSKKHARKSSAFFTFGKARQVYTGFGFSAEEGQAQFITSYIPKSPVSGSSPPPPGQAASSSPVQAPS